MGAVLVFIGIVMQVVAWRTYRRDIPEFWVSRPIWYFLYPKGVVLFVIGVWIILAGVMLYYRA